MRALSATELLDVWEQGFNQPLLQRALTLLAAGCPEVPPDELAQLSIGQRDAGLLALRELTFGPQCSAVATCPMCSEKSELEFLTSNFQSEGVFEAPPEMELKLDGFELCFRLPTSADLAAVGNPGEGVSSREMLLDRCLLAGEKPLPAGVAAAVIEKMARSDPLADIQLALTCASCGYGWPAMFDVVSFFWSEIHAWAMRLLRDVHLLASAYGWSEADILALSAARRQAYLEMVTV